MNVPAATVLVVDDDDDVRALAVAILHEAGYRALPAANGDTALTLLQNGLIVDLLFTDIVMPGELDGFRLAVEARRIQPDIKLLYTTGFSGFPARISSQLVEAPLLKKPYRPATLAAEVMRVLEHTRPFVEPSLPRFT
jgi:DNA-binding NtrC family response regulator